MPSDFRVIDDFHLRAGFGETWQERYVQVSAGAMTSRLTMLRTEGLQVFRKSMSERVVQQGALPAGSICFALPMRSGDGRPAAQGRELQEGGLLVLRAGEEFTLQRPRGMELLAVTLPEETFREWLDSLPGASPIRALLARPVLRLAPAVGRDLQLALLAGVAGFGARPLSARDYLEGLGLAIEQAVAGESTVGQSHAAFIVARCHAIVAEEAPQAVSIEALCRRLRVSRRSLQNSFRQVADAAPLDYLRSVRLNAVRDRLMASTPEALSVSQAASDQGFEHLGHFTQRYKRLFGQLPSTTPRGVVRRQRASVDAPNRLESSSTTVRAV